jgi:hypothetical protein
MITLLGLACTEVVQSRHKRAMSVSGHEEGWSMITVLCLGCTEVVQSRQRRAMSVSGHEEGWSPPRKMCSSGTFKPVSLLKQCNFLHCGIFH